MQPALRSSSDIGQTAGRALRQNRSARSIAVAGVKLIGRDLAHWDIHRYIDWTPREKVPARAHMTRVQTRSIRGSQGLFHCSATKERGRSGRTSEAAFLAYLTLELIHRATQRHKVLRSLQLRVISVLVQRMLFVASTVV